MSARKPFLLRVEPGLLAAVERWAADDLRSVNGQIEFLLREALRRAGRKVVPPPELAAADEPADDEAPAEREGQPRGVGTRAQRGLGHPHDEAADERSEEPARARNDAGRRKAPRGG